MELCADIRDLRVSFGGREVLHGVTAELPAEGITVLLGRSGSGKTTLLRSLNRLNECFEGYSGSGSVQLRLDGELRPIFGPEAPEAEQLRRRVGMVFQSPNPLPLSLRKNITMPLELTLGIRRGEAEARMEAALRRVGLWDEVKDRLSAPASAFSGGQQQRLCLARTLALSPELLLLDEPTASLDRKSAELVEELLLELRGEVPVIMVSHSLAQARKLGSHFAVMADGRITRCLAEESLPHGVEAETLLEELL